MLCEEDTFIWQLALFFLYLHFRRVFSHVGAGMLKYHLLSHKFPVLGEGNDFRKITEFASSDRSKTNVTQCPVPVCLFRSKHTGYNAASLVYLLQDQEHSQVVRRTPEKLPPPSLHWISLGTNRISSKPGFSIALYCLRMTLQCIAECLFLLLLFLFWLPFCCYLIIFYLFCQPN